MKNYLSTKLVKKSPKSLSVWKITKYVRNHKGCENAMKYGENITTFCQSKNVYKDGMDQLKNKEIY